MNGSSNGALNGTHVKPSQTDDLETLTGIITRSVQQYESRREAIGLGKAELKNPFPPFVKDTEALEAKFEIMRACEKMMAVVQGPTEWLMFQNMAFVDAACVSVALELGIPDIIAPGEEPTSLDYLVAQTGASRDLLERVMRVCTQRLCFEEVAPQQYIHNAVSMPLTLPPVNALVTYGCDDAFKTAGSWLDTLRENKFQISDDPNNSAFNRAFRSEYGMFDYFNKVERKRGERFALAMAGTEMMKALTEDMYPFDKLPNGATVIDCGGGLGSVSLRIAEVAPQLSFIVQDLEPVIENAKTQDIPEAVRSRITFQAHSFFDEQPIQGAEVYMFRFILHDHPDTRCIKILSNIIKAMDPAKSRILIDDAVVPDYLGSEGIRFFNFMDVHMCQALNARERSRKQWEALFKATDERLVIEKIWEEENGGPQGGRMIELRLKA